MTQQQIITFSSAAVTHIQQLLAKEVATMGFRLSVKQTGCSGYMYIPEIIKQRHSDDLYFVTPDGLPVYIEKKACRFIQGTHIDFVAKQFGMKQLTFNNPNAQNLCGCGESFNLKEAPNE